MQNSTTVAPRVGFKADGIDPKLSVGKVANGAVNGKVASDHGGYQCGKAAGSAVTGFSGSGVKAGKV